MLEACMIKNPLRTNKRVIATTHTVGVWVLHLTAFNPVNRDAKGLSPRNEREREWEWSKPHCTTQTWSKSLLEMGSDLVPPSDFSHQNRLTYANMLSIASSKIAAETRSVPASYHLIWEAWSDIPIFKVRPAVDRLLCQKERKKKCPSYSYNKLNKFRDTWKDTLTLLNTHIYCLVNRLDISPNL